MVSNDANELCVNDELRGDELSGRNCTCITVKYMWNNMQVMRDFSELYSPNIMRTAVRTDAVNDFVNSQTPTNAIGISILPNNAQNCKHIEQILVLAFVF